MDRTQIVQAGNLRCAQPQMRKQAAVQVPAAEEAACPLADFLGSDDDTQASHVALSSGEHIQGFIATTTAVDAAALLEHFELDAYDGLMPAEVYDEVTAQAAAAAEAACQADADREYHCAVVRGLRLWRHLPWPFAAHPCMRMQTCVAVA